MVKLLQWFSFIVSLLLSTQICAQVVPIDVYGTDSKTAEKIIMQVGPDLEIVGQHIQLNSTQDVAEDKKQDELIAQLKKKILDNIYKMGEFAYVNISPVIYQDLTIFLTIDLIEKKDNKRLAYLPNITFKPTKNTIRFQKEKNINQLLQAWMTYEKIGFELMLKGQAPVIKNRPAYHCLFGFDDPKLKRYLTIFEKETLKNKQKLITILKSDPDEERRKTAAFLLAHIKDGKELIDILTPSISDPSARVRNNVMRVLGEAISIVKPTNFDIDSIIQALDFPDESDRNKALYMIESLTSQPKYARYVAQHAGTSLMASLKMLQPNLHNNAYFILRQISGLSYDERDYESWEAWLVQQAANVDVKS